ncbi:hypothetical protein Moror_11040 [Moniliophthora roreri MCA 2997]|uniref:Uncharacterized protein n=1 Tax=Moniliophthora roreri (strain MCA 2997) TaxID=1381753 RepID=V2WE07_MONRO|nr:hypothetical protein Moror_11040 [Moniliophthora roreri MCA 2997]
MPIPEPTLPQLRGRYVIHYFDPGAAIAILATSFRLYLRVKRRNVWWDDFWALSSMLAIVMMLTGMLIFT